MSARPAGVPPVECTTLRSAEIARDERARIARELHDIIAHSVTVMMVQAGGAERVLDRDPERSRAALAQIRRTGTEAMEELGRMLRVLRAGDDERVARDPVGRRGVDDIAALVAEVRGLGARVVLTEEGRRGRVDPSVDLAAYRVVQEALTNFVRHGSGAAAEVCVCWGDDLAVTVANGQPAPAPQPPDAAAALSTGNGLVGLRERVAVIGGRLEVGATVGGGFRVSARLPLCREPGTSSGTAP